LVGTAHPTGLIMKNKVKQSARTRYRLMPRTGVTCWLLVTR